MEFSFLLFSISLLVFLLIYLIIPDVRRKNLLLIASSLLLIGILQPGGLVLYLLLAWMTYKMAKKVRRGQKSTVILPVAVNLAVMLICKYLDVLLDQTVLPGGILLPAVNKLIDYINAQGHSLPQAVNLAPLGLSFYMLLAVAYLLDIYRGRIKAESRFGSFLLYFFMFPKFFQGPLVRYRDMALSLRERRTENAQIFFGLLRFCTGLGKKVLLADGCGRIIMELAESGSDQALIGSWQAAVLFFFRVYFDFSGCCDMAIGLGGILGFRFPENFNRPYQALSVTEFCERWNLTVRRFFMDYVYHPMKAKKGAIGQFLAGLTVVLLYGLWHGGTYNYVIFAVYFAAILLIEKNFQNFLTDLPYWLRHTLTILCLIFGWVIFMHTDLESLVSALKAMIGDGGFKIAGDGERFWNAAPLMAVCWIGVTSLPQAAAKKWRETCGVTKESTQVQRMIYLGSYVVFMALILWFSVKAGMNHSILMPVFMSL